MKKVGNEGARMRPTKKAAKVARNWKDACKNKVITHARKLWKSLQIISSESK